MALLLSSARGPCWSFIPARLTEKVLAVGSSVALRRVPLALAAFKGLYQKVEGMPEFEIQAVPCPEISLGN